MAVRPPEYVSEETKKQTDEMKRSNDLKSVPFLKTPAGWISLISLVVSVCALAVAIIK